MSPNWYSSKLLHELGDAFDDVWQTLRQAGYPPSTRILIANYIIILVKKGERDYQQIVSLTLKKFIEAGTRTVSTTQKHPH
jgi:hypothetical protein